MQRFRMTEFVPMFFTDFFLPRLALTVNSFEFPNICEIVSALKRLGKCRRKYIWTSACVSCSCNVCDSVVVLYLRTRVPPPPTTTLEPSARPLIVQTQCIKKETQFFTLCRPLPKNRCSYLLGDRLL